MVVRGCGEGENEEWFLNVYRVSFWRLRVFRNWIVWLYRIMNILNVSNNEFIVTVNLKKCKGWSLTTDNLSPDFIVRGLRLFCSCLACCLTWVASKDPMFLPCWCMVMSSHFYLCWMLTWSALFFLLFSLIKFKIWIIYHFSVRATPRPCLCVPIAPYSDCSPQGLLVEYISSPWAMHGGEGRCLIWIWIHVPWTVNDT